MIKISKMSIEQSEQSEQKESSVVSVLKERYTNLKNFFQNIFKVKKDTKEELGNLTTSVSQTDKDNTSKKDKSQESVENLSQKTLREEMAKIIARDKTYDEVNKNDCGSVSIGKLQSHTGMAVDLLKKFKERDSKKFTEIMKDPIFSDLEKAGNAIRNDTQKAQFQELMKNKQFQEVMDNNVYETMDKYISKVKSRGVTNGKAILAWGRICNYGSGFAKKLCDQMKKGGRDINDYSKVIDEYEQSPSGKQHKKFQKKYDCLGNKNIREYIATVNL